MIKYSSDKKRNKTNEINLMKCSYRYYKKLNRLEEFKKKKPEIYQKLIEINYIIN